MFKRRLERRCERYLQRRGRVVLPRYFNGIAFGYATAVEESLGVWSVLTYPKCCVYALNNSTVQMSAELRQ